MKSQTIHTPTIFQEYLIVGEEVCCRTGSYSRPCYVFGHVKALRTNVIVVHVVRKVLPHPVEGPSGTFLQTEEHEDKLFSRTTLRQRGAEGEWRRAELVSAPWAREQIEAQRQRVDMERDSLRLNAALGNLATRWLNMETVRKTELALEQVKAFVAKWHVTKDEDLFGEDVW